MGMEDFFLGAIGGVAQAGAQGASVEFKNEQELLRQQSLLDLQNRYKSKALKQRTEAEATQRERLLEIAQQGLDSETPTAEQLAAMDALGIEKPEIEKPRFSEKGLSSLADFLELDVDAVRGAAETNSLPALMSAKLREPSREDKELIPIVNTESGAVLQVPEDEAARMTALNEAGEQVWQTGRVDGDFVVAPGLRVKIPEKGDQKRTQLQEFKSVNRATELLSILDIEYANPALLTGRDTVEKAQGSLDTIVSNVGRAPIIGDTLERALGGAVEEQSIAGRSTLNNLVTQAKQFFDLPGRSLTVEIKNLMDQISAPDALSGFFTRDAETFTKLKTFRDNVSAEVSRARERDPDSESVQLGEGVLESIDTIFANRLLSNTLVPIEGSAPIRITDLKSSGDFEKLDMEALRNDPQSLAAVRLWGQRIAILEGK